MDAIYISVPSKKKVMKLKIREDKLKLTNFQK